ncbi:MAG TPA: hypothetical protein VFL46_08815 [Phycicoccus sp.]|nr:hypothetical protein [Phycicoccus sp.]
MSSSLALAVLATGTAGFTRGDTGSAAAFTVSAQAQAESNEQANLQIEDSGRLAADRGAALDAANVNAGAEQEKARVRAARVAQARKEAAERAARDAQRKRIIADAVANPKAAAQAIMGDYGFGPDQWGCLEQLWIGESGWNYRAANASSGAYGIPQSLPGSKMASVGSDWQTNPVTQIKWGLNYIKQSYGTPCGALNSWNSRSPHWY